MTLLQLNDAIQNPKEGHRVVEKITSEDVNEFNRLISINNSSKVAFDTIDDANAYFSIFPDIKKIIGSKKCVEVFYALKCGFVYDGVPGKLTYMLIELFKLMDKESVNRSLNSAVKLLDKYAGYTYGDSKFTVKDIIENILGKSVSLLTDYCRKVKVGDYWEVWIPGENAVALIPDDIANMLSSDNLEELYYDSDKGLMLKEIPLRTLNNRVGCTLDDFDLRNCF